eukprot:gene46515-8232_t
MANPAPGMANPARGMANPAPGTANPALGMANPALGMADPAPGSGWVDVTPRIINLIRSDGGGCFQVLNELMGSDPNVGAEKTLEILYIPGRARRYVNMHVCCNRELAPGRPGKRFEQVHLRDPSLGHCVQDDGGPHVPAPASEGAAPAGAS